MSELRSNSFGTTPASVSSGGEGKNSGGRVYEQNEPRQRKDQVIVSEESQKIDSANEELMRFRKLRESLTDGVL